MPEAAAKIAEYEIALGRSLNSAERAAVVKTAVLKTRPGKTHHEPVTLVEQWRVEAEHSGYRAEDVLAAVRDAAERGPEPAMSHDAVAIEAVRAAASARAWFTRADVAGQVAARLLAGGSAADVLARVEELTDAALGLDEAVSVGRHPQGMTPRA